MTFKINGAHGAHKLILAALNDASKNAPGFNLVKGNITIPDDEIEYEELVLCSGPYINVEGYDSNDRWFSLGIDLREDVQSIEVGSYQTTLKINDFIDDIERLKELAGNNDGEL